MRTITTLQQQQLVLMVEVSGERYHYHSRSAAKRWPRRRRRIRAAAHTTRSAVTALSKAKAAVFCNGTINLGKHMKAGTSGVTSLYAAHYLAATNSTMTPAVF